MRGVFQLGSTLPVQKELAKRYGVSQATASAAVGRLVHEGLARTIRGQGTFVSDDLPVRHRMLDFVRIRGPAAQPDNANKLSWIETFTRLAEGHGWTPRWHHVSQDQANQIEQWSDRLSQSEGVVVLDAAPVELPWCLYNQGIAVLTVLLCSGGLGEAAQPFPQISFDRFEATRLAAEHLVSLGYSSLGYLGEKVSRRLAGFMEALRHQKLAIRNEWIVTFEDMGADLDELARNGSRALDAKDRPQAFCCSDRNTAHALLVAARRAGINVPQDLAVIACDDGELELVGEPRITTVAISREESCKKALDILDGIISTPPAERGRLWEPIMMPLHLTIKDSCGAAIRGMAKDSLKQKVEVA